MVQKKKKKKITIMGKRAVSRDKGAEVTAAAIACWNLILMPEEKKKEKTLRHSHQEQEEISKEKMHPLSFVGQIVPGSYTCRDTERACDLISFSSTDWGTETLLSASFPVANTAVLQRDRGVLPGWPCLFCSNRRRKQSRRIENINRSVRSKNYWSLVF